jgi:hypothetical protein
MLELARPLHAVLAPGTGTTPTLGDDRINAIVARFWPTLARPTQREKASWMNARKIWTRLARSYRKSGC